MSIKEIVQGNKVRFLYYRKGELWYDVITMKEFQDRDGERVFTYKPIFTFPVPIEDTGDGTFNAEDKAIYFMRYIRKYLEETEKNFS